MIPFSRCARAAALALIAGFAALPVRADDFEIVPVTSPGGITAWLYEDHTIPIITLEASFRGGAALEHAGEAGVTTLMANLLSEGAGDLDATTFAEAREALAASFRFSAGADDVSVSATTLKEELAETMELFSLALTDPRFDADALDRMQAGQLASLRSDTTNPNVLASRALWALAFPEHPYATPTDGLPETVEALGRAEVEDAHDRALARDRLMVAVVGAISPGELAPLLDAVFGALPAEGPPPPEPAEAALDGGLSVIDLAIPQSVVTFGHGGIPRDHPDFIPAFVLNHILGGSGFGSRLQEELREKRGLTYGIYSYLVPNDYGWLYLGSFSASNARVVEAIELVQGEWRRMAEAGVTADELENAKRYLTGAYPLRFDGTQRIASQLLGLQTAGLGIDYVNERNDLVNAVTLEDIDRVAGQLLDPEALTFVVVGQPEGIEPAE